MTNRDYWLDATWQLLVREIKNWINDLLKFRWAEAIVHWVNITLYISTLADLIVEKIEEKADAAIVTVETWATDIIGVLEEGADNIVTQLGNIWNSTASLWDQFGPNISSTVTTVEQWVAGAFDTGSGWATAVWKQVVLSVDGLTTWLSDLGHNAGEWVRDKADEVWDWIDDKSEDVWDWISKKSDNVWDWIRIKSSYVWDWITGTGTILEDWYNEQHEWLSDIFDNKRETLASFLDDPGSFIVDWVIEKSLWVMEQCVLRFW